ncbi:MAG: DUF2442 domain-containing protein [Acetobacter okinawensis]|nr:DUF2442 domain-containing protein [Acetobacter okinawensis]
MECLEPSIYSIALHDQIADVKIFGRGYGLHWEALDLNLC